MKDNEFLVDRTDILPSFYSSMYGEMTDKKRMTTVRQREKRMRQIEKRNSHTLFADISIFKQRVNSSEINRLRKNKNNNSNQVAIMISEINNRIT